MGLEEEDDDKEQQHVSCISSPTSPPSGPTWRTTIIVVIVWRTTSFSSGLAKGLSSVLTILFKYYSHAKETREKLKLKLRGLFAATAVESFSRDFTTEGSSFVSSYRFELNYADYVHRLAYLSLLAARCCNESIHNSDDGAALNYNKMKYFTLNNDGEGCMGQTTTLLKFSTTRISQFHSSPDLDTVLLTAHSEQRRASFFLFSLVAS